MAGVFELTNVLELIIDGFDQGSFAEQNFIPEGEHAEVHLFFEFGEELHSLVPKLREEGLGDVATIANEFAEQPAGKFRDGLAVIDVAGSEHDSQQFPAVANHQVDLEAIEPARAR